MSPLCASFPDFIKSNSRMANGIIVKVNHLGGIHLSVELALGLLDGGHLAASDLIFEVVEFLWVIIDDSLSFFAGRHFDNITLLFDSLISVTICSLIFFICPH